MSTLGLRFHAKQRDLYKSSLKPPAKSAVKGTLTIHYQWEDKTARERTDKSLRMVRKRKLKLPTLHTKG